MPRAVLLQCGAVGEQHEVGACGVVDDLEAVAAQVTLEKRLRVSEQQCSGHAANVAPLRAAEQMSFRAKA